jgi:hypothetical protein
VGVKFDREKWKRFREAVDGIFDDFDADLKFIGEQVAAAIIQTTLAGLGENDGPFKQYSPKYKELIEAVGGKPGGVVNLRGVFYHDNKSRRVSKTSLRKGGGRRAYVLLTFGGRSFIARTRQTRPQSGLIDKESEMSLDLIEIKVPPLANPTVFLIYRARKIPYMVKHNETRRWFTLKKSAVRGAAIETMRTLLAARVDRVRQVFNQ